MAVWTKRKTAAIMAEEADASRAISKRILTPFSGRPLFLALFLATEKSGDARTGDKVRRRGEPRAKNGELVLPFFVRP
jgi:hypothetical protein